MQLSLNLSLTSQRNLFSPANVFMAGEQGVLYDPSDLTSMYQDSAGTTAAVVGQPVGLLLDKRLGLVRGAELVTNGGFDDGSTGWSNTANATSAVSGGELEVTSANAANGSFQLLPTVAGKTYEVVVLGRNISSFSGYRIRATQDLASGTILAETPDYTDATQARRSLRFVAASGTTAIYLRNASIGVTAFDNVSVRELPGNHATQATAAARPILQRDSNGRPYLEFDGVDDFLRATFAIAQPWDRVSALRQITWVASDRIYDGANVASAGTVYQDTSSPRIKMTSGSFGVVALEPLLANSFVLTERHAGVNSRAALDNGGYNTGDAGTTAADGITIGARAAAGGTPANIRLYGVCMIGRALTDSETAQLRSYMAGKAGVIL